MKTYLVELNSCISGYDTRNFCIVEANSEAEAERFGFTMLRYSSFQVDPSKTPAEHLEDFLAGHYDDQLENDDYWRHEYALTSEVTDTEVEMLERFGIYKLRYELVIDSIKSKLNIQ
jgi:hypothetical protein